MPGSSRCPPDIWAERCEPVRISGPSVEIRNTMELIPSSRDQADVRRTSALNGSNLSAKKIKPKELMLFRFYWSECRDSNSRPLEPHSSAIPNFATPGYLLAPLGDFDILAHLSEKCKYFFCFFSKNFLSKKTCGKNVMKIPKYCGNPERYYPFAGLKK